MTHCFTGKGRFDFKCRSVKAHGSLPDSFLNDSIETDEGSAANKQDLLRIDLDILLMRMFPTALGRNVACAAFENLQKGLLNSFSGNISSDTYVVGFASDLVDLININNPDLS